MSRPPCSTKTNDEGRAVERVRMFIFVWVVSHTSFPCFFLRLFLHGLHALHCCHVLHALHGFHGLHCHMAFIAFIGFAAFMAFIVSINGMATIKGSWNLCGNDLSQNSYGLVITTTFITQRPIHSVPSVSRPLLVFGLRRSLGLRMHNVYSTVTDQLRCTKTYAERNGHLNPSLVVGQRLMTGQNLVVGHRLMIGQSLVIGQNLVIGHSLVLWQSLVMVMIVMMVCCCVVFFRLYTCIYCNQVKSAAAYKHIHFAPISVLGIAGQSLPPTGIAGQSLLHKLRDYPAH